MSRTLGVIAGDQGVMCLLIASMLGCQSGDDVSGPIASQMRKEFSRGRRPIPNRMTGRFALPAKTRQQLYHGRRLSKHATGSTLCCHHTATDRGNVESINRVHKGRKDSAGNNWLGIGYHFVIGNGHGMDDGVIETTFRWRTQIHGAHAGSSEYNNAGIGICLVGNFNDGPPTRKQLAATQRLVRSLKQAYGIDTKNIVGHGDVKKTACPGRHFQIAQVTQDATKESSVDGRSQPSTGTGLCAIDRCSFEPNRSTHNTLLTGSTPHDTSILRRRMAHADGTRTSAGIV